MTTLWKRSDYNAVEAAEAAIRAALAAEGDDAVSASEALDELERIATCVRDAAARARTLPAPEAAILRARAAEALGLDAENAPTTWTLNAILEAEVDDAASAAETAWIRARAAARTRDEIIRTEADGAVSAAKAAEAAILRARAATRVRDAAARARDAVVRAEDAKRSARGWVDAVTGRETTSPESDAQAERDRDDLCHKSAMEDAHAAYAASRKAMDEGQDGGIEGLHDGGFESAFTAFSATSPRPPRRDPYSVAVRNAIRVRDDALHTEQDAIADSREARRARRAARANVAEARAQIAAVRAADARARV